MIVIVGAGVAGLSAAAALSRRRFEHVVLEAGPAAGGRALTQRPQVLGGAVFDAGAVWLHDAARNPLVSLSQARGEALIDTDGLRNRRTWTDGAWGGDAAATAVGEAWEAFERTADTLLAAHEDLPLTAVADARTNDPWALTIERWEGPVIAAADADAISLADVRRNALDGANMQPREGGLGDLVARLLPAPTSLRCDVRVDAIRRTGAGLSVRTSAGTIKANAAIVTVSTAALGRIDFSPALPDATRAALAALPMGQVLKCAIRRAGPGRLGLPSSCLLEQRRTDRLGVPMIANAWPAGRDHIWFWIGGANAARLERTPAEAGALCREFLRDMFGAEADRALAPGLHQTHWHADPAFGGAYSYAIPGQIAARKTLGVSVLDGRVIVAGEATVTDGLAGTVGGAFNAGRDAAARYSAATHTFALAADRNSRRPASTSEPSSPSP